METHEERSFDPRPKRMGEMKPPNLLGLSAEERDTALLDMINQVHDCVEQGHADADRKRVALARQVRATQKAVRKLSVAVGIEEPKAGETRPTANLQVQAKVHGVAGWPAWKLLVALGAIGFSGPALVQLVIKLGPAVGPVVWTWLQGLAT
jgi:hypothetical protein